jgi:hypothetical protein
MVALRAAGVDLGEDLPDLRVEPVLLLHPPAEVHNQLPGTGTPQLLWCRYQGVVAGHEPILADTEHVFEP